MDPVTFSTCAVVLMIGIGSIFSVNATKDVEKAVKETKPAVEQQIEKVENHNITNITNNDFNGANITYETKDDVVLETLRDEVMAMKEEQQYTNKLLEDKDKIKTNNRTNIIAVGEKEYVTDGVVTIEREPLTGPRLNRTTKAAGWPAICTYCGEQGQIHRDIIEWQDDEGSYHLTHRKCGQPYCEVFSVIPRTEEAYKIK